ncbi:transporter substrate-binding domain-containing protein [Fusibacter paucivorans]|uniref:Stage 0 sporulation protein A homolog n=1 Tax=Fusibacter paucivorans TaxID=76009 RepID=A0ABS5PMK4_9FIRM|nr:transporter substrate-binding domain-containing protein [Fusibacter paucivorans]MBS7525591.1 transporter substrate-binding domain-containing protein [Fusibacter paucivorans]
MKRIIASIVSLMLMSAVLLSTFGFADTNDSDIYFTQDELDFIAAHPLIHVGVDTEFVPFEFVDDRGRYEGIASEYLTYIQNETGLSFDIEKAFEWPEIYNMALEGEIDLLPALTKTESREADFYFSNPYYTFKRVIVVSDTESQIRGIDNLTHYVVAVQENSSHHSYLSQMKGLSLSLYPTAEKALAAVASGKERVFVGNLATTNYIIRKNGLTNLKMITFESDESQTLHFAASEEMAPLIPIINKVLINIPEEEKIAINSRWVTLNIEPDYSGLIRRFVAAGLLILLLFIVSAFWIVKLKKEIAARRLVEEALTIAKKDAEYANQVKSNFLARMSHEIRTPLNAIYGISHLLKNTEMSAVQTSYVNRIVKSSKAIIDIVNDILDYSKIDADKMTIERITFDLDHLIQNIIIITSYPLDRKKLHFRFYKEPGIPNMFFGDRKRIEQVLINLLNNAVKFTEEGEIAFEIKLRAKESGRYILNFIISDTGIGMSKKALNDLFQPFQQADGSISRKYGGTGLGLSIVKRLVELMDGKIDVYSTVGEGTSFVVELPLEMDVEGEKAYQKERQRYYLNDIQTIFFTKRPSQLNFLINSLKNLGINAHIISDEEAVIKHLREAAGKYVKPYDLVIVDFDPYSDNQSALYNEIMNNGNLVNKPKIIALVPYTNDLTIENLQRDPDIIALIHPVITSVLYDAIVELFYAKKSVLKTTSNALSDISKHFADDYHKILIVDDNLTNQMIVSEILAQHQITYYVADNGKEAIEQYKRHHAYIALILMDLHMPIMNGFEASEHIQALSTEVPILAMTADVIEDTLEKLNTHGMVDYILKPFDPDVLIEKIAMYMKADVQGTDRDQDINSEASETSENNGALKRHESRKALEEHTSAVMDFQKALHHTGLPKDKLKRILSVYRQENEGFVATLENKLSEGDYVSAEKMVHKLKSSTGGISADTLHKELINFQAQLKDGDEAVIHQSFVTVKHQITQLLMEIDAILSIEKDH